MRSRELVRKELAELFASRAFWLLLIVVGLLVGQSFIGAVEAYAEASGIGGGPAALAQGLSPLDGILSPTAGAYDLAITLLFPFVVIRLVAAERSSGALKLMLQWPAPLRQQMLAKLAALLVAWALACIPFAIAMSFWTAYGGHLDARGTANLLLGYTLRFVFTACLAMAAAAVMPGAANAAIVVLAFTIGTWALDFLAAGRGGAIQALAGFTPAAVLRTFERGLLRVDVILITLILSLLFYGIAIIALRIGDPIPARITRTAAAVIVAAIAIVLAAHLHASYDLSENRRNSFPAADERALANIRRPLVVTVYLAAEDPRMNDFENDVLVKLRRAVPDVSMRYPFGGRSALFENDARYGEVHYAIGGKTVVSRATTEEIVLETVESLAGLRAPQHEAPAYPGYPLAARPRGAAAVFYGVWPLLVLASLVFTRAYPAGRTS